MIYPGETWRLGADGDTTLKTEVGLKFGESSVARGTYILRAKFLGDGNGICRSAAPTIPKWLRSP